eukprot:COSAG04_NODE_8810_length_928_cov_2.306393_1_plen_158_part_01
MIKDLRGTLPKFRAHFSRRIHDLAAKPRHFSKHLNDKKRARRVFPSVQTTKRGFVGVWTGKLETLEGSAAASPAVSALEESTQTLRRDLQLQVLRSEKLAEGVEHVAAQLEQVTLTPQTPNPEPQTDDPQPKTQTPYTTNAKPQTHNHQPPSRRATHP